MRTPFSSFVAIAVFLACVADEPPPRNPPGDVCRVERDGSSSGPHAEICAWLVERWTLLTGDSVIPGVIRTVDHIAFTGMRSAKQWTLDWPAPRAGASLIREHQVSIIPHEAGHKLFGSHTMSLYVPSAGRRYASAAPDWFDESPAIWMESADSRARRMNAVRGTTPPLATLLTMPHPTLLGARADAPDLDSQVIQRTVTAPCDRCTWLADSLRTKYQIIEVVLYLNGRADTVTSYADRHPGGSTFEELQFYPLVYSILRFIHARGGSAAFRELVERYQQDPSPRADILVGLPGLANSVAAIERDWHQFLKAVVD